ncbi:hypothetical protein [Campylobacter vulpis]|uniref:hypothetical protein n=1 Tax=Campylobacter vulpis TaxID=1655500 RepID=UPI0015DE5BC8|nr:hypothetical protein [Campylobacter vulpis]
MTFLTCDYNGHKEVYTADGKEVDYSTFCDLRTQNALEANPQSFLSNSYLLSSLIFSIFITHCLYL